jgi:hypothetical protein
MLKGPLTKARTWVKGAYNMQKDTERDINTKKNTGKKSQN